MDLEFSSSERAFQGEVRDFLAAEMPHWLRDKVRAGLRWERRDDHEWRAVLNKRGWVAPSWPVEYGGTGWDPIRQFIFERECALAGAPHSLPLFLGINMIGQVLIKYGSEAQKRHWLPRILSGEDWWCQGYSEPGSGSDLASLETVAVRDGDHYVVNGRKIWTSIATEANMMFCLVRTDPTARKQAGISFLLIDMNAPGVRVRQRVMLEGTRELNEVYFTDVCVPVENLVGEQDKGWDCAKYLLTYERTRNARVGITEAAFGRLKQLAWQVRCDGRPLAEDPLFAARLARIEIDLENMKTTNLRVLAAVAGGGVPGAESSMLKICGTQILQAVSSLARRAVGPAALPFIDAALVEGYEGAPIGPPGAATLAMQYFYYRSLSIIAGSNEIQRNIVTKMILGL